MVEIERLIPYILMKCTLVFELISFLTSHMVDSRVVGVVHEGLFHRCKTSLVNLVNATNCFWWSADTFANDRASLQCVTVLAFLSLFLIGFTVLFGHLSYFYRELRSTNYTAGMTIANALNVVMLLIIVIVYTFVYSGDEKTTSAFLVFSWSYYLLFAALATNILSTIFFLYNPMGNEAK